MKKEVFLLMFILGFCVSSCITNKDLIYLQNNVPADSASVVVKPLNHEPYRVQVNDILKIDFKAIDPKYVEPFNISNNSNSVQTSEQQLYFTGFKVDDHGNIRLPVIGELNVMGYTTEEVRLKIEKKLLEEYFNKEANIYVSVKIGGIRYSINGEITNPGINTIYNDRATIMDAIAYAGDITDVGNRREVVVIRQFPHGSETHTINLLEQSAMDSPFYILRPNDYIYIKPLKQKTWGFGTNGVQTTTAIISALSLIVTTFLLVKNIK